MGIEKSTHHVIAHHTGWCLICYMKSAAEPNWPQVSENVQLWALLKSKLINQLQEYVSLNGPYPFWELNPVS